jgi:hypothetical protein
MLIVQSSLMMIVNGTVHIRHQCRKTAVLSCHRCLINTGVEKMNYIYIWIRTLITRCLYVRENVGIQMIVYIFKVLCSIDNHYMFIVQAIVEMECDSSWKRKANVKMVYLKK